jgi:hypothetical protein
MALLWARKDSERPPLLAGTLGYFLVTDLFYLVMGMYNILFLVYTALLCTSFFALTQILLSIEMDNISDHFRASTPVKWTGLPDV